MTYARTRVTVRRLAAALSMCVVATIGTPAALAASAEDTALGTEDSLVGTEEGEVVPAPTTDEPAVVSPEPTVAPSDPTVAPPSDPTVAPSETTTLSTLSTMTALRVPTAPVKALPSTMDLSPGMQQTISCDPTTKPGVIAFADLLASHYGKTRRHFSRACVPGGTSQHHDGRALDWTMNAYDPADKALGDSVAAWLTADYGAMAKRFGIMYIIWDRRIWYVHRPLAWEAYYGPSPHTDHLHFSFTWDGAMKRTSWWTATPVTQVDHGPCRVYAGQYAPRYSGRQTVACSTRLPLPPPSPYPVYLPGASHPSIQLAQASMGITGSAVDGVFGPATLTTLLAYQKRTGLPVTGVLDNVTWVSFSALQPQTPFDQLVASPDLTGDGRADLIGVDSVGRLHIYPGAGDGRLGGVRPFGLGWDAMGVYAPGDWDGDGHGDLVAVDADGVLFLYAGTGSGALRSRVKIGHGWTGYRIVPAGDVDNNGTADLLGIDSVHRLWLYPGDGRGGFGARVQVGNGWRGFDLYAAGDMNRDGLADILSIDPTGGLWFYAGRGRGYFDQRVHVGYGWTGYEFASGGDFDGDGINDLMGRDPDGLLWYYQGRRGGTFAMKVNVGHGW